MAGPEQEEEGALPSSNWTAQEGSQEPCLGHTAWAHDPSSRHPDFSPPGPAASPSANWMVPIFWPLSAQWALVQLPAWLPAQDGHGRQQALVREELVRGEVASPQLHGHHLPSLSEPRGWGTQTAVPTLMPPLNYTFSSGVPHETRSLPFPTLCPP